MVFGCMWRAVTIPHLTRRFSQGLGGVLLLLLSGCVFITGNLNPFVSAPQPLEERVVSGEGKAKVVIVDISRVISSQEEEAPFGITRRESVTARVRQELQQAGKDDRVRAVVLRINSPGGTVTASDTVYHEIMTFKAEHPVPVIAQFLDMGTSGAYYVALAADEIVASPTTVTGSIGVVMYGVNFAGLMAKVGIKNQTIKSGEKKDIGSPLRPMTPDDARLLQDILGDLQQHFLTVVRTRRPGLSADTVRTIADGRILTADQALQMGLIDRIGYLRDTLATAKQRAGLTEARVVMYRRPDEFAENIYSTALQSPVHVNLVNLDFGGLAHATPQFLYMWLPPSE
jgi:protease-4